MVNKGNHPQMAARFRLVKYYNLPRYIYIYMWMCCLRMIHEGGWNLGHFRDFFLFWTAAQQHSSTVDHLGVPLLCYSLVMTNIAMEANGPLAIEIVGLPMNNGDLYTHQKWWFTNPTQRKIVFFSQKWWFTHSFFVNVYQMVNDRRLSDFLDVWGKSQ